MLGGETAELPGIFNDGEFDIAGFAVGARERQAASVDNEAAGFPDVAAMTEGDVVIGLPSSGVHCSGYELVQQIIADSQHNYESHCHFDKFRSLGDVLLTPTKCYVKPVLPLLHCNLLKGAAHIATGGLISAIAAALPPQL